MAMGIMQVKKLNKALANLFASSVYALRNYINFGCVEFIGMGKELFLILFFIFSPCL